MLLVALALGAPPGPAPAPPSEGSSPPRVQRPAGEQPRGFASRLWGAQLLLAPQKDRMQFGGAATQMGFGLGLGRWISFRYQDTLSIGGLAGKLSYRVQLQLALGLFYRLYRDHGLVLRGGIATDWHGAQRAHGRWLRVPEVQLGWGGVAGALQYEALATASPYVYHRWRESPEIPARTAHSASVGAIASLLYRRIRLTWRADWSWFDRRPWLKQQGDLCVHFASRPAKARIHNPKLLTRKKWFGPNEQRYRAGLCASARRTAQWTAPQLPARTHFGLLLSLGKTYFLDPIR